MIEERLCCTIHFLYKCGACQMKYCFTCLKKCYKGEKKGYPEKPHCLRCGLSGIWVSAEEDEGKQQERITQKLMEWSIDKE